MNSQKMLAILIQCMSVNDLPAHIACRLTNWLISCEVKPGGPYLPNTLDDKAILMLNIHAVRLFSTEKHPLKGALSYIKLHQAQPFSTPTPPQNIHAKNTHTDIEKFTRTALSDIEKIVRPILITLEKTDILGEISQLSSLLVSSITIQPRPKDKMLTALNRANILTWCAYGLYDIAYDETPTDTTIIPVANIVSRKAFQLYVEAGVYSDLAQDYLHKTDSAQLKELQVCRFNPNILPSKSSIPSKKILNSLLSEKSIAHCIGPLSIIQKSSSKEVYDHFVSFCYHYCKARQLLDDIHDWRDDFTEGKWTYVTAHLARHAYKPNLNNLEILERMKHLFWDTEAHALLEEASRTLTEAERIFLNYMRPHASDFLNATLYPLKRATLEHKKQIKNAKYFINNL